MAHFNRDSRDYHFIDEFEAGLVLTGSDVKSIRTQTIRFQGARVEVKNGVPVVIGLNIPVYKYSQSQDIDTTTERKLLLKKNQIARLQSYQKQKYQLIPIKIFISNSFFKLKFGVGKKMKKFEKREKLKKKDFKLRGGDARQ